jgi:hypothetical protein
MKTHMGTNLKNCTKSRNRVSGRIFIISKLLKRSNQKLYIYFSSQKSSQKKVETSSDHKENTD